MIFTIFRDFSEFFLIFNDFIFYLNRFKINKKNKKYRFFFVARGPRGCDVACKATWQRHANLCNAYVARIYIVLFILYLI